MPSPVRQHCHLPASPLQSLAGHCVLGLQAAYLFVVRPSFCQIFNQELLLPLQIESLTAQLAQCDAQLQQATKASLDQVSSKPGCAELH